MNPYLLAAALLFALAACASPQAPSPSAGTNTPAEPDSVAVGMYEEAAATYMRFVGGEADSSEARALIPLLLSAYEIDTTYLDPLDLASNLYLTFSMPDSAVATMELGVPQDPSRGELIGYILYGQGRESEAQSWFERTLASTEASRASGVTDEIDGYWLESFEAGWIRLRWLAEGEESALQAFADTTPEAQDSGSVLHAKCLAETATVRDYILATGFSAEELQEGSHEQSAAVSACNELLSQ